MKNVAEYYCLIVFQDCWNNQEVIGCNHNSEDRHICLEVMLDHYKKGTHENHLTELREFYEKHSEGGNHKHAEYANWVVGRFATFIDALSAANTVEEFEAWREKDLQRVLAKKKA